MDNIFFEDFRFTLILLCCSVVVYLLTTIIYYWSHPKVYNVLTGEELRQKVLAELEAQNEKGEVVQTSTEIPCFG